MTVCRVTNDDPTVEIRRLGDVPIGWQIRSWAAHGKWYVKDQDRDNSEGRDHVVECRPKPEPTVTVTLPRSVAEILRDSMESRSTGPTEGAALNVCLEAVRAALEAEER